MSDFRDVNRTVLIKVREATMVESQRNNDDMPLEMGEGVRQKGVRFTG
jgi:hypothetical protein